MVRVLLAAALAFVATAAPPKHPLFRHGRDDVVDTSREASTIDVAENYFETQKLDHTNATNPATWKQRYFFNDQFYGGPGSPVFLFVDDSMSVPKRVADPSVFMNELAKKHKALVVALEHRYYGKSLPVKSLELENLQYLSIQQALSDVVTFQDYFAAKQNLSGSKWVAFGSTYGGSLVGWLQSQYPNRFAGAVASSPVLDLKVDFPEYGEMISKALGKFGGDSCVEKVKTATTELHRLTGSSKPDDVALLEKLFKPCSPFSSDSDRGLFETVLMFPFEMAAYRNDVDSSNSTAIGTLCKEFEAPNRTPLETLAYLAVTDVCTFNNFDDFLMLYTDTEPSDLGFREDLYEQCTEYVGSYLPGREGALSPLKYMNSDVLLKRFCKEVFGITDVDARVAAANKKYGGLKVDAPNVVWTSGEFDPWRSLSLTNATGTVNPRSMVVDIPLASTRRDTVARKPTDLGHVEWAHQKVENAVEGFLRNKC